MPTWRGCRQIARREERRGLGEEGVTLTLGERSRQGKRPRRAARLSVSGECRAREARYTRSSRLKSGACGAGRGGSRRRCHTTQFAAIA